MWQWCLLLLLPSVGAFAIKGRNNAIKYQRSGRLLRLGTDYPDLEKCLYREYSSFFSPMEKSFYSGNVKFIDPMTSFEGIEKYQNNVDMLAGRTGLGKIMFKDASIVLHNIEQLDKQKIQTRWTLQVTVKILPWQPRAKFTGVSVYTIDSNGKVIQQDDYWDSVNLVGGKYVSKSTSEGIKDFLAQLRQEAGAEMAAPELPYELLRRAGRYEVRRYPATLVAETTYDQRPEGYDRLGSYAGGSNENGVKIPYYSPTLMKVSDSEGKRRKIMSWPVAFAYPGQPLPAASTLPEPTIPKVTVTEKPGVVVAVTRFELAATEPIVRGYTGQLLSDVKADKMTPSAEAESGDCVVGQFDALFSLNKRRNEVWAELVDHPWK